MNTQRWRPSRARGEGSVYHHIQIKRRPITCRVRGLDPVKLAVRKAYFYQSEKEGFVRRSKSAFASALHMVPKLDRTWRPYGDFRTLNAITNPDRYPIPHLQNFASNLKGCRVFCSIVLVKAYHQIPVAEDDIEKTAIRTPFGL